METGNCAGVTLDLSFGLDDPNFSDRTLLLHIIDTHDHLSDRLLNANRRHSDDQLVNASADTTLCTTFPPPPRVKTIHINSLILAARSPFFRKLFSNGMQESEQKRVTLQIEAIEEASFMDLLNYIYSNKLPTTVDALLDLSLTADKFEVDLCLRECNQALQDIGMTYESASAYLDLPPYILMSPMVQPLVEAAKNFIAAKFKDLYQFREEVLNLNLLSLQGVLSSDDLKVPSEMVVFELVLVWAHKHYPESEERRKILKTQLLHLVRYPFMSIKELIEAVQTCKDIDPELASEILIRALSFKAETDSNRKRCLAAEESKAASCQFVARAYTYRPVKVVELELPYPKWVVYLDLTNDELKRIFPEGDVWSKTFVFGGQEFGLSASCYTDESDNLRYFGLNLDVFESSSCTVKYEFSVIRKPQEDFEHWFRGQHTFIETENYKDLYREEWTRFIGDDSPYFINDILHLRAELTIMT